jgi:hypothetical protein
MRKNLNKSLKGGNKMQELETLSIEELTAAVRAEHDLFYLLFNFLLGFYLISF